MSNPSGLEPTEEQVAAISAGLNLGPLAVGDSLSPLARAAWPLIRDMVLEAVLDQIDENRNALAYGACGCAEAVRGMKGDDDDHELTEASMIENERQLRAQGINSAADIIARSRERLFPRP